MRKEKEPFSSEQEEPLRHVGFAGWKGGMKVVPTQSTVFTAVVSHSLGPELDAFNEFFCHV